MNLTRTKAMVFRGLGLVAVALGFVGVFVPGMPTTVFVLIASYLFARSSPQLNDWLERHRWFGPTLRRFRDSGGMTRSAKSAALASMWIATSISALMLVEASRTGALATVLLSTAGTLTILFAVRTVPDRG